MSNLTHQYAAMQHSPFLSGSAAKTSRVIELELKEDNLNAGDRFDFIQLPADAVVTNVYLAVDELDSDGTPAVTLDIKAEDVDGGNTTALETASTAGQAGGVVEASANLPILTMDKDYYLFVEVNAAPATAQEGNARLIVEWFRSRG